MSKETTGISKHKIQAIAIAIFLTLSMGASMMLIPSVPAPSGLLFQCSPTSVRHLTQQVSVNKSKSSCGFKWFSEDNAELTNNYRFTNDL